MTTVGEVLEVVHNRRPLPDLNANYRVWAARTATASAPGNVAHVRSSVVDSSVLVEVELGWWGPEIDLGSPQFFVDLAPAFAACSLRVDGEASVAGRAGWRVVLADARPPLAFPPAPPAPLSLFPHPGEPAVWDLVVDNQSGILLALTCRVGDQVLGSLEMLPPAADPRPTAGLYPLNIPAACREAGISVDGLMIDYMIAFSAECHVVIECDDGDAAHLAAESARRAVALVPHPEEPDDPLPSFVSDVEDQPTGASFWWDMADAEAYDGLIERVLDAILEAMAASGLRDARLTYRDGIWST